MTFAFNELPAGVSGRIVAVLVDNNETVDTNTALFKIDTTQLPSGSSGGTQQENDVNQFDSTGEQNRNRAPGELLSITGPDGWDSLNPYNSDGSPHYPNLFYGQAPVVKNRGFFTRLWEKMTNPNKCPFCNEHCGKEINRIVVDEYQDVQTRNINVGPEVARITGSYYERRQVVVNNYRFQIHGACFECQKTWEYFSSESSIA